MTKNMRLRILSAIIMGSLIVAAILWVPILFYILVTLIAAAMLYEWFEMTKSSSLHLWLGLIIVPCPIIALIFLRKIDSNGWLLLTYFAIISAVDTFAMLGGQKIGGPKLAPRLSPNKTWSGLVVGVLTSAGIAGLISTIPGYELSSFAHINKKCMILGSGIIAYLAQMSDLFMSYFKRKFGIKDSGAIIPGHGGAIDRFDSIILTAPILYLAVIYL